MAEHYDIFLLRVFNTLAEGSSWNFVTLDGFKDLNDGWGYEAEKSLMIPLTLSTQHASVTDRQTDNERRLAAGCASVHSVAR